MKTILVTGAYGFVGRNLCVELKKSQEYTLLKFGSSDSFETLKSHVSKSDVVVHLAGINRPKYTEEFYKGNKELTEQIVELVKKSDRKIPIIYSSTTQAELENDYGRSKLLAEESLINLNKINENPVSIFRLPNLFGKWSKPNYNSVVATWCNNLSNNQKLEISNPDVIITLAYIDDVIKAIKKEIEFCNVDETHVYINKIYTTTLGNLSHKLISFKNNRSTLVMPDLKNDFDKHLYSTYLSYLNTNEFGYNLKTNFDNRGWLAEFIKSEELGQIFISKTKPGITRGNHWHHSKVEKFLVIDGEGIIKFRQIENDIVLEYPVTGKTLKVIDIPPGYTHSITNTGTKELITIFWANEIFNLEQPDTTYLEV